MPAQTVSEASTLSQIRTHIDSHLQKSTSERLFLDPGNLRSILTHNAILGAILECSFSPHLHAHFANEIFQRGIKVFAILIHIRKPDSMTKFLERNELDARLPFSQEQLSDILQEDGKLFLRSQWDFLPHIFQRDHHQHIADSYILPFLIDKTLDELEGGFGAISEITIASSMQALVTDHEGPIVLIRKRIKAGDTKETRRNYDMEKECLELLRLRGHPNILELFASYTYRGEYNFLFPRIDMDLEQFLAHDEKYGLFRQNVTYITAIEGLSSALESIHNLHLSKARHEVDLSRIGYHHDLRPRNILVTSNTFLLADFGLSRFKGAEGGSRTKWKENIGDYIAPECMDQDFEPQDVGRAIDVWAFGGIVFDLAWHREQGVNGVNQSRSARRGPAAKNKWDNQCFFLEDEIKPKVIQSSNELRLHSKDATTVGLLNLAFSMLQIEPQERPLATDVRRNMTFLTVKSFFNIACERLKDYTKSLVENAERGIPSTKLRFEVTRLDAWASVLGLGTDGLIPKDFDNAMQSTESNGRNAEGVLKEIEDAFKHRDVVEDQTTSTRLNFPLITIEYYEERHELLHQLVERLLRFLPPIYRKRVDQVCQQLYMDTNNTKVLGDRSLAIGSETDFQYGEIIAMSSMRVLRLALYDCFRLVGDVGLLLPGRSLKEDVVLTRKSKHRIGLYSPDERTKYSSQTTPIQVLVERIYCPPVTTTQSSEERTTRLLALAELLHQKPKPKDFRVLDCLGFIDSILIDSSLNEGFDFLYQFPDAIVGGLRQIPKSLDDLLKAGVPEPALEDKIDFAKAVVSSIHQLHAADWLHRNISPKNILFFVPDSKKPRISWEEPYLVNFSHSRPDGYVWVTDGPAPEKDYQHPEYLADGCPRFRKRYDYYSIGVVLLEVGLWQPLVDKLRGKGDTPAEYSKTLIQKHLPNLRRTVGKRYRDAVRECLEGGHLQETVAAHQLSGFFEYVMEPLFEIQI